MTKLDALFVLLGAKRYIFNQAQSDYKIAECAHILNARIKQLNDEINQSLQSYEDMQNDLREYGKIEQ